MSAASHSLRRFTKAVALGLIRGYQLFVSPVLGSRCGFYPTCSAYTVEAVERFGLFRGLGLGLRRLSRCHPFSPGGVDPVPERDDAPPVKRASSRRPPRRTRSTDRFIHDQ